MSLLMDALKRAEKARQAEASSDGAELDLAATQGFSLDPIDESASGERPLPREPTLDQPVSPSDTGSGELSLEDTRAAHGRLGIEEDDTGSRSLDDTGGDSISIIDDEEAVDVPHQIPQDTSATLPSIKQARQSVDNYFDGTGSMSVTRDDLDAALTGETTAPQQRVVGDTDTQRRVRAVFHAKEASRSRRGHNWLVVGLVPLLLVAAIGGALWIYGDGIRDMIFGRPKFVQSQRTPAQPAQPAAATVPMVASAAVDSGQPSGAAATATSTQTASPPAQPSTGAQTASGSTASPTTDTTASATQTAAASAVSEESQSSATEIASSAPSVAEVTQQSDMNVADASGRRLSAEEFVAEKIKSAGLAPASPTGGAAFKITRRSKPDQLHPRLAQAYSAWRAGDLAAAKRDYERVLRTNPRNRNALLGLGAIAVRNGQWDNASELYTALLRQNPRDSIAQAGLIAVHENVDPLRGESQIKLLLREEPDAPHLYFTLGNMYAAQGRWGEAQSAYFEAFSRDSGNADYAYNLAVSLDQLGKGKTATDYYRQALSLAAENGAVFDQPSVRDRILKIAFEDAAE